MSIPATLYCRTCCQSTPFKALWVAVRQGERVNRRIRAECLDCGEKGDWLPVERFKGMAGEPKAKPPETPSLFDQIEGL